MAIINYFNCEWGGAYSGGHIFDTKLISALSNGNCVNTEGVVVKRRLGLPVWRKNVCHKDLAQLLGLNIVSHEALYELVDRILVHCFIVHNFFCEFSFHGLGAIDLFYRTGSYEIYLKVFSSSERIMFLSSREMRLAGLMFPEYRNKFFFCPPGYNASSNPSMGVRCSDVVELPGTADWLPKKISYFLNVRRGLPCSGELVSGEHESSYISIIYDAFLSGFKLKLIEMARHGKSVISFTDLREELASIGFSDLPYRFVRTRAEFATALRHFQSAGDMALELREQFLVRSAELSWEAMAAKIVSEDVRRRLEVR